MKCLITGFEPFGEDLINPSLEAIQKVSEEIDGIKVIKAVLPVVFHEAVKCLDDLIERKKPDVIICVGVAGGRAQISIERIGINIDDARIADNAGQAPIDVPINSNGPAAYFSTLPVKAIVNAINERGIPAQISNTAGTYVCNHVLYGLLDIIAQKYPQKRGGFIHVPFLPIQVINKPSVPSMHLDDITLAIESAISTCFKMDQDIKLSGGVTC